MIDIDESSSYPPGSALLHASSGVGFRIPREDPAMVGGLVWEEIFLISHVDGGGGRSGAPGTLTLYLRPSIPAERVAQWVAEPPEGKGDDVFRTIEFPDAAEGLRAIFRAQDRVAWKAGLRGPYGNAVLVLGEAPAGRSAVVGTAFQSLIESLVFEPPSDGSTESTARDDIARPDPLRWTHCYAFLFFVASRVPGGTNADETRAIAEEMMSEWDATVGRPALRQAMAEALDWLEVAWAGQCVQEEIDLILRLMNGDPSFDRDRRRRLLAGLGRIMAADGRLDDDEITLHRYFQDALDRE